MATIKQITIEYGYTFNLGNCSNVRPVVTLTAELAEGENVQVITEALQGQARYAVEDEIERALELQGKAPHFRQLRNSAKITDEIEVPF